MEAAAVSSTHLAPAFRRAHRQRRLPPTGERQNRRGTSSGGGEAQGTDGAWKPMPRGSSSSSSCPEAPDLTAARRRLLTVLGGAWKLMLEGVAARSFSPCPCGRLLLAVPRERLEAHSRGGARRRLLLVVPRCDWKQDPGARGRKNRRRCGSPARSRRALL
jgi:hypothetical protein